MSGINDNIFFQIDNMNAVNEYIETRAAGAPELTHPKMRTVVPDYRRWWNDLGWYEKHFDKTKWDQMRDWRDKVNDAMGDKPTPYLPSDAETHHPVLEDGTSPLLLGLKVGAGLTVAGFAMLYIQTRPFAAMKTGVSNLLASTRKPSK